MTALVWTVRRIVYRIRFSKHSTIIYTDHETNFTIIIETKFSITNIHKLNIKFIKVFIYFFQFRIKMRHKFEKFNVVSNALNKLSIKSVNKSINNLNIDAKNSKTDQIYVYVTTFIEIFFELKKNWFVTISVNVKRHHYGSNRLIHINKTVHRIHQWTK